MAQDNYYSGRLRAGWLAFMILAGIIFVFGMFLLQSAFAVNMTAVNEAQDDLNPELAFVDSFSIFWVILLFVMSLIFTTVFIRMRNDREMSFFSIASLIVSILLAIMFVSPIAFDYQTAENHISVEEIEWLDGNHTYNAIVTNTAKQVIVIPADQEFRLIVSLLFTGKMIFDGLYTMFILTNWFTNKR